MACAAGSHDGGAAGDLIGCFRLCGCAPSVHNTTQRNTAQRNTTHGWLEGKTCVFSCETGNCRVWVHLCCERLARLEDKERERVVVAVTQPQVSVQQQQKRCGATTVMWCKSQAASKQVKLVEPN